VLVRATTIIWSLSPDFYTKEETITSVANTSDYSVATDFNGIISVERKYGTGASAVYQSVPILRTEDQSVLGFVYPLLALPDTLSRRNKTFSLIGTNKYRIEPCPVDTSEVYRVKYIRKPVTTDLTVGTEVKDIPDHWAPYIALDVARIVYQRKGDPRYTMIMQSLNDEYTMLRKAARRRTAPQAYGRLGLM